MKNFKEVAHFFIGCEVQTRIREATESMKPMRKIKGKLMDVDGVGDNRLVGIVLGNGKENENEYGHDFLPILRKFEDADAYEVFEFCKMYHGKDNTEDWTNDTGSANYRPPRRRWNKDDMMHIINGNSHRSDSFAVLMKMIPWITEHQFDFLNLIESGLAIDKKTLNG